MTLLTVSQQRALINIARFGERYGYWPHTASLATDTNKSYGATSKRVQALRDAGYVHRAPKHTKTSLAPTRMGLELLKVIT